MLAKPKLRGFATRLGVALIFVLGLGCDRKPKTPAERGAGIYVRSCAGCHGPTGVGVDRPGFRKPPRNLTDPEFQTQMSDDDIADVIKNGKGQMPAFGVLLDDQALADVILHVRSLKRP